MNEKLTAHPLIRSSAYRSPLNQHGDAEGLEIFEDSFSLE
jgi:hypothetical protein